jgi:predicted nucleic acid-binding protein
MAVYLLDTSVIIDVLNNKRGRPALLLELARAGHTLACCPINITEVYAGLRPKEEAATEQLLSSLRHFPIEPEAARMAGEFKRDHARKGVTLNLCDVIIAAVAIHNRLTLLTDNLKDFPMRGISLYPLPKA